MLARQAEPAAVVDDLRIVQRIQRHLLQRHIRPTQSLARLLPTPSSAAVSLTPRARARKGIRKRLRRLSTSRAAASGPSGGGMCCKSFMGTAVPSDGERVRVGDSAVASSAWLLQAIDDGRSRNVCAFPQPHWRR